MGSSDDKTCKTLQILCQAGSWLACAAGGRRELRLGASAFLKKYELRQASSQTLERLNALSFKQGRTKDEEKKRGVAQMLVTCSWVGSCIWFNFDLDELDPVDADADARSFVREERIRNRWADESYEKGKKREGRAPDRETATKKKRRAASLTQARDERRQASEQRPKGLRAMAGEFVCRCAWRLSSG